MSRFEKFYQGRALNEGDRLKIEAILDNYPKDDSILKIYALENADFRDEEDVPSGLLMVHPIEAKVHVDSIPEEAFQFLIVMPIHEKPSGKEWKDSDFDTPEMQKALDDAVPRHSESTPGLDKLEASTGKEIETWEAELGDGDSSFAGVMKRVHSNGRGSSYFVVAQAGVPKACQQLKEWIGRRADGITFGELLDSNQYSYVRYLARRNTERLAWNVARAFKAAIYHTEDSASESIQDVAVPLRAEPMKNMRQPVSTLGELVWGKDGVAAVGIFHKVRPAQNVQDICMVNGGPYEGIAIFNMAKNAIGYALPATTGPNPKAKAITDKRELSLRKKGVFWGEGERNNELLHPQLEPTEHSPIESDAFLAAMRGHGWRQQGTDTRRRLIPVMIKMN